MLTIITFLLFTLTTYFIFKGRIFKNTSIPSSYIAIAFALKLLVIVAFVNYLNSHPEYDLKGDHESYLNDSNVLNSVYHKDPKAYFKLLLGLDNSDETREFYLINTRLWSNPYLEFNDCRTVIRVHSILDFLAFGNHYLHLLFVNFISIFSCILLVKAFSKHIQKSTLLFLILSLGIPTFFIYSGLVLKEYILIFGIACFLYAVSTRKLKSIYFWIGLFLLGSVKQYVLAILLVSLAIYFLFKYTKTTLLKGFALIGCCALVLIAFFSPIGTKAVRHISNQQYAFYRVAKEGIYLHEETKERGFYYYLDIKDTSLLKPYKEDFLQLKTDVIARKHHLSTNKFIDSITLYKDQIFFIAMIVPKNSGSYVEPYFIHYEKNKLFNHIPNTIFYTFSQPSFSAPGSKAKYPIVLETILISIFSILSFAYALFYHRRIISHPVVISLLFFILATAFIVGITTPVIGAMVRYRIPTFLATVIISFILIDSIWKRKSYSSQEQAQE